MLALFQSLVQPRQIIITNPQSSLPVRHANIRPLVLALLLCALFAGSFLAGSYFASSWFLPGHNQDQLVQQIAHLQHEQKRLKIKSTNAKALLNIRQEQIEDMQQNMKENQKLTTSMQQQLKMFEEILAARKVRGVHLLQASSHWQKDQNIAYSLVLVKGENYPRLATGSIQFSTQTPQGETLRISAKKGEESLKYSMKTHVFLQGDIPWTKEWQPEKLVITLFNHRGKKLGQSEVVIDKL